MNNEIEITIASTPDSNILAVSARANGRNIELSDDTIGWQEETSTGWVYDGQPVDYADDVARLIARDLDVDIDDIKIDESEASLLDR